MRGMAEWPNLDDVAVNLVDVAYSSLSPFEMGVFVRLVWGLAGQSVNTYSSADPDPRWPDDNEILARVTFCTKREWKRTRKALEPYFDIRGGHWRLRDPSIIRIMRPATRNPIPAAVKSLAAHRGAGRCSYCGDTEGPFHHDHLFPVAKGGTEDPSNIVLACTSCNLSKHDKTILEWVDYLRSLQ